MARIPLPPALLRLPVAHRALHDEAGRPENSLAAIQAAIDAGYAIEIDLQLSSDGVAMVFHDEELARMTGVNGLLAERTAGELVAMPLRGGDAGMPLFADVLALVGGRVPLLIELKDQTLAMAETDGQLEAETARLLADYRGAAAVMSFNPHTVAHMARLAPGIARGLITSAYEPAEWTPLSPATCARLRDIPDYDASESSFISHEAADLARPRVAELKAAGAAVLCWTIRSPEMERAARKVADNITFEGYAAPIPAG